MNIDMLALKRADPMAQPCTNIWRVEPKYSDPRTLIDNWRENRAKTEVSGWRYCMKQVKPGSDDQKWFGVLDNTRGRIHQILLV